LKELLFLTAKDVETINLPMVEIIAILEDMFREKGTRRLEVAPRSEIPLDETSFSQAIPASLPGMGVSGVKWVSVVPQNLERALPRVTGLLILNDSQTGLPISVMDAAWITAKRTGAATAVAAKYLARKDSKVFGVLGCGVQGRSNLEGVYTVLRSLEEVRAYDISQKNLDQFVAEMSAKFGLKIEPVNSPREMVRESDVFVTAGERLKSPNAIIERNWIADGVFACALDLDTYWTREAMFSMDKFCTDDTRQVQHYMSIGYLHDIPNIHADLGQIVIGERIGREDQEERIFSMHLGLALEDIAVAAKLYERAKSLGVGEWVNLG
jgi:ornithine cyclodeaminase/alanine dehydrogenase